jgi:hypothetical protein
MKTDSFFDPFLSNKGEGINILANLLLDNHFQKSAKIADYLLSISCQALTRTFSRPDICWALL